MQRNASDSANAPHPPRQKLNLKHAKQASSPLKQRMEEVLKGDRRAIHEPLAHLQATYFAD
jgi:hypothetical protein